MTERLKDGPEKNKARKLVTCSGSTTLSADGITNIVTQEGAAPTRYDLPTPTTTPACDAIIIYTVTVSPCLTTSDCVGSVANYTSTIDDSDNTTFELPDLTGAAE